QLTSRLGQLVHVPAGVAGVGRAVEDAALDEAARPIGKDRLGDVEVHLEVVEPADAVERVAHDQERPALSDDLERAGDRAVLPLVIVAEPPNSNRGDAMHRLSKRIAWLPAAAGLLGAAWGANQFSPLLLVYHQELGLITGLLIGGPLSDVRGRRSVVVPAAWLSLVASLVLASAGHTLAVLFAGRLLAGVGSGAMFSAGTAWLRRAPTQPAGRRWR